MSRLVYLSLVLSAVCGTSSAQPSIASGRMQLKNVSAHPQHSAVSFAEALSDVKGQSEHEREDEVSGLLKAEAKTKAKAIPPVTHSVNVGVDIKVGIPPSAPIASIAPIAPFAPIASMALSAPATQQMPGIAKCGSVWVSAGGLPIIQDSFWVGAALGMLGCTLHVARAGGNTGAVAYAFKAANPHGSLILHARRGRNGEDEEKFPSFLNSDVVIHSSDQSDEKFKKMAEAASHVIALPGGERGFREPELIFAKQAKQKILCLAWGGEDGGRQLVGRLPVLKAFKDGCQKFVAEGKAEMVEFEGHTPTETSIKEAQEKVKSEIVRFLQVQQ